LPLFFALVGYVLRFPDVRIKFTLQGIFVWDLCLAILDCLSSYSAGDQAAEWTSL